MAGGRRDKLELVPEILVGEGHEQDEAVEVEREAARDRLIVCRDDVVIVLDGLEVPKTVWDREAASDDRASAEVLVARFVEPADEARSTRVGSGMTELHAIAVLVAHFARSSCSSRARLHQSAL